MFLPGSYRDYRANGRLSGVYQLGGIGKEKIKEKGNPMKCIRSLVITIGLIVLSLSLSPTFGKGAFSSATIA
jgi:hypothetical protein